MVDHLDSKNFVPFSRRRDGFRLPGVKKDREEEMLEQVDPDLRPEDEGLVRRYLNYADILLGSPDQHGLTLVPGGGPAKRLAGNAEPSENSPSGETARDEKTARSARVQSIRKAHRIQNIEDGRNKRRSDRTLNAQGKRPQRLPDKGRAQNDNNSAAPQLDDEEAA